MTATPVKHTRAQAAALSSSTKKVKDIDGCVLFVLTFVRLPNSWSPRSATSNSPPPLQPAAEITDTPDDTVEENEQPTQDSSSNDVTDGPSPPTSEPGHAVSAHHDPAPTGQARYVFGIIIVQGPSQSAAS